MNAMASQITSLTIVYSTVNSGADQRKHQSSASLAFVRGNSPVTSEFPAQRAINARKMLSFDDVIMCRDLIIWQGTRIVAMKYLAMKYNDTKNLY